jgi:hypothetical protein
MGDTPQKLANPKPDFEIFQYSAVGIDGICPPDFPERIKFRNASIDR